MSKSKNNKENSEGESPSREWLNLKLEVLEKIKKLDLKTDRRNTDETWWLEMSTLKRLIQQSIN